MSLDLGPGTPLICVDASAPLRGWSSQRSLTRGALYFCDQVINMNQCCPRDGCGTRGVQLRERMPGPGVLHVLFCPNRFKPLGEGGEDLKADNERAFSPLFTLEDFADRLPGILRTLPSQPGRDDPDEAPAYVPILVP
jgi:hypothetical protein